MAKFLEINPEELAQINSAYAWMEKERKEKGGDIIPATYSTIADYYVPFDMHISFFYDTERDKLFVRTFMYASGMVTYEEVTNPDAIINESDESRTIAWMLLRTGAFLCK